MNKKIKAKYEARANVIKAMAHPARLLMVDELSRGKRSVQELTDLVGSDMSTVSKHLSILKNVGIVSDERAGTTIFYRLKMPCILGFFGCVETVLKASAKEKMNLIKL
jgi:DNA-binding transcriptional ArsR family regulator